MGQREVLEFLEKNKNKWFTAKEIYENINIIGKKSLFTSIKKLREFKLILSKFKEEPKKTKHLRWFYKYKRLK